MELSRGLWLALWIFYRIISENQANSIYTRGQVPLSVIPWQPQWFPIWLHYASICLPYCIHVFFIFFSPSSALSSHFPCCSYEEDSCYHCGMIIIWGLLVCLSYLINTGNKMYTGMRENVQKIMPSVTVSFLRHQKWCRMLKPLWPQSRYELHAGRAQGNPLTLERSHKKKILLGTHCRTGTWSRAKIGQNVMYSEIRRWAYKG